MCSKLMGFGSQCYHHTGSCLPSLCLSPSRIKALAKAQRSSPVPPSPAAPSPATSFIFHTQPSRTETLVRNFTEAPERCFLSFFSAEEGRGVTAQGEGFVEFARGFFFSFSLFCNTSCSGECPVLFTLSGSGSRCGSRSSLKRCYCRRHGREEPELSIQPSWSSQAARLGRAAHGTAGSRGRVESSLGDRDTGASSQLGLWDLLGLMGGRA